MREGKNIFELLKRRKGKTESKPSVDFMVSSTVHTLERRKPKAVAFVDYEYWLFSSFDSYHLKPDVLQWAYELKNSYDLIDIRFYGDFSQEIMSKDLSKIRQVSNQIIETKNGTENHKKNFTDFIMLDTIYQSTIFSKEIDTFILFTGDGHFSSVVSFLKNKLRKSVIIYGIKNSFSYTLKSAATSWVEIPSESYMFLNYFNLILKHIAYVESESTGFKATFWNTVHSVANHSGIEEEVIIASLQQLIEQGDVRQKTETVTFQKELKVLVVNWEKAIKDGFWNPDT